LQQLFAEYTGVPKRHVILNPGSVILLREIIHYFSRKRKVIVVYPSFFPNVKCMKQFATKSIRIQLKPPELNLNPDLITNELREPCLIIIDNPNNPTGKILINRQTAETILENKNGLLVIDEAYYEFSGVTFADMVEEHPNLAIMRTMTKAFGLAGARIGYLLAGEDFLDISSPFNTFLPQPSLYAAIEAMKNPIYVKKNIELTIKERNRVSKKLDEMGFKTYPSVTNFLLVKSDMPDVAKELMDRGVSVLDLSHQWLSGFIRVSMGTSRENDIFLSNIMEIDRAGNLSH
jgi:histidinol-phosphate aminotransferase